MTDCSGATVITQGGSSLFEIQSALSSFIHRGTGGSMWDRTLKFSSAPLHSTDDSQNLIHARSRGIPRNAIGGCRYQVGTCHWQKILRWFLSSCASDAAAKLLSDSDVGHERSGKRVRPIDRKDRRAVVVETYGNVTKLSYPDAR